MAEENLFEELKAVLADFKGFLDENVPVIKPAIQAIASLVPQVKDLIDLLIELVGKLKTAVNELDVGNIPGLETVSELTGKIPAFLEAAKKLLPNETSTIDAISDVTDVVTSLPGVDAIKEEIVALLDAITVHLNSLKP
ncbi:hypothetical protein [Amycolatopsis nigrescens]|uniref:hypothetical protein n=1 Tax=Amycolatopsis nigrescens TaxID=381445 RepID=UPI00036F92D0|nr:hypothetical protein [Amycolatopsis nigrescens]